MAVTRSTMALIGAAILGLAVVSGKSFAAGPDLTPSAEAGEMLARALCSTCHLMDGASSAPVVVGIPSLAAIANRQGQSAERIEAVLIKPHAPMPDMKLSYPEIRDLLAYLEGLRTDKSQPSLVPQQPTKDDPKLPKPS